jgi:hypothetical protein
MSQTLTPEDIFKLRQALPAMPDKQKRRTLELLKQYGAQMTQTLGKESFLDFINHVYPGYKVGPHHLKLIQIFLNKERLNLDHKDKVQNPEKAVFTYLSFSIIWSLGANLHESSRSSFGTVLRT